MSASGVTHRFATAVVVAPATTRAKQGSWLAEMLAADLQFVLLGSGRPRRKARVLNYLSAVTVGPGALMGSLGAASGEKG